MNDKPVLTGVPQPIPRGEGDLWYNPSTKDLCLWTEGAWQPFAKIKPKAQPVSA